jgi:iron complex outermembrane receptor protein
MSNCSNSKPAMLVKSLLALAVFAATSVASAQIEEIVVTATKRAESLQDVPISMVALSGEAIKNLGITRGEEFTADIPAVTIAQNPISNFVFIRGIGTSGSNAGIEQSVSIFHDGIYMGRHQLSRSPFMDLERVEVLRGPQGILFGKNTIGGAMHVIAAKPTRELEGSVSALIGSDGEQELTGVISGALSDTVRARLAVRSYQYDGFLDNVITQQDGPQREDKTFRAQIEWDASESLRISAKLESSTYEQSQQSTQLGVASPFDAGAAAISGLNQALVAAATGGNGVEGLDGERAVDNDGGALLGRVVPSFAGIGGFPSKPELSNNNTDVGSITADWDIGGHTITSVTGFAQYDFRDICDCDFAALPLIQVDATEDYQQFSQEFRLTSPAGETLEYIAGLYYQDADLDYRSVEGFGTALLTPAGLPTVLFPNMTRDYRFVQEQETKAVFGQLKWNFADATRATVGLRYSDESKNANHRLDTFFTAGQDYSSLAGLPAGSLAFGNSPEEFDRFLATPALAQAAGIAQVAILQNALGTFEHDITRQRDEDFITWSLGLQHDFSDDTMGFATISTGVKGGGFDARFLRRNNDPFFEFEEEEVLNYEVGFKSSLLEDNLQLNATAFFSTVENYQVSIFDGATAFFVQNAAEVESKGVEVDLKWLASDNFLLSFSGVYLNAEYSSFPNAPCFSGSDANNRGNCIGRGTASAFRDASGETNMFSPEFSFNLNLDYNMELSNNWELRGVANINYSDDFLAASDLDPIYAGVEGFTKLDLRLSLSSLDGKWDFALLGKNLTEEFSSGSSNDQPLVPGNGYVSTDRLRSIAAQATYRF